MSSLLPDLKWVLPVWRHNSKTQITLIASRSLDLRSINILADNWNCPARRLWQLVWTLQGRGKVWKWRVRVLASSIQARRLKEGVADRHFLLGSTYWVRQFDIYWVRQLPNIYWTRQWDIYSTRQLPNIYWVRQNEFYIVPRYLLS